MPKNTSQMSEAELRESIRVITTITESQWRKIDEVLKLRQFGCSCLDIYMLCALFEKEVEE